MKNKFKELLKDKALIEAAIIIAIELVVAIVVGVLMYKFAR